MVLTAVGDFMLFIYRLGAALTISRPRLQDVLDDVLAALRLGWRPIVAICIPFGMAFGFSFDSILGIIGARPFAGPSIGPAVIRQAGPLVASLVLSTVVGSAFCADLGARATRDEIAASEVMAVNPISRLVIPRVFATMIAAPIFYLFASAAVIFGGFVLLIFVRGSNAGTFIEGLQALTEVRDIMLSVSKSIIFGWIVGLSASYFGLKAEGGPAGVASKVRLSIMFSVTVTFLVDLAWTSLFYVE